MKKILVIADPIADPQLAFKKALSYAQTSDAKLHVVSFCFESMGAYEVQDADYDFSTIKVEIVRYQEERLSAFIKENKKKTEVTHEIVWEKYVHHWVEEHCKTSHYDMIVKTGHRSEGIFYTPTDWQLFRNLQIPIYVVNKESSKTEKVVLVALDFMCKSEEKQQLNRKLLETAFKLTIQLGGSLHCCYAIHIPTLVRDLDLIDIKAHVHKVEREALVRAEALLSEYDIDQRHCHIKQGEPSLVLKSLAADLHAQCLVVGMLGRKGITGKIVGNTAEKVIHGVARDLLVISPSAPSTI